MAINSFLIAGRSPPVKCGGTGADESTRSCAAGRTAGNLIETALAYQKSLQTNPHDPNALAGMSVVALTSGLFEPAGKLALAALEVAPGMGMAWVALGQALCAAGHPEQAEAAYCRALQTDGKNEVARLALGELRLATGRAAEAILEFELALRAAPMMVGAHLGLGHAKAMLSLNEEALERYERALALSPRLAIAEFAAGFVLTRLGRKKEAERRYRRALVARPDFAAAWMNLGILLRECGQEAYAAAALRRAVELRPDLVAGWVNLAIMERERRHPERAEAHLRKAFALNPERKETHVAWCQFRASEEDLPGAWGWLRWALARTPDHPEALNMLGILLHKERRFAGAVNAFEHAEVLGHLAAASNRGNALLDMGRIGEALAAHMTAVGRDPTHPGARYNLALTRLRLGEWKTGWAMYEARLDFREVHRAPRIFPQRRWRGEALNGRRILLHAEQGLGDTIQFCRYANLVAEREGAVILQVQPAAERLLRTLAVTRSGLAVITTLGTDPPEFDLECPLMSLPAVFATEIDTVPWTGAYLAADPALAEEKKLLFPASRVSCRAGKQNLLIGVAWAGNARYKGDRERSMELKTLSGLLSLPGITWVSLQKGVAGGQLAAMQEKAHIWDACSCDHDLAEAAAVVSTLDLVITTDTCIAHLAGRHGQTSLGLAAAFGRLAVDAAGEKQSLVSHRAANQARIARRLGGCSGPGGWHVGSIAAGA